MYQSPIEVIYKEMRTEFENNVYNAIQEYGVCVDKDELIKALRYDRGQYEKGYADGIREAQAEWISVDERLPDDCGMPVLMVAVNRYGQSKVVKGFTNYTCPFEFLTNEKEYESVWQSAWKVTHWMPLPEAPMMKGGAG